MQKRAVAVTVAAVVLGLVALVLGFAAEYVNQKAFVRLRVPAHAGAGLGHPRRAALAGRRGARHRGQRLLRPLRRRRRARGRETARRLRQVVVRGSRVAGGGGGGGGDVPVRGASPRSGGGPGATATAASAPELRGVFVLASIAAVVAVACAITAYVDTLQRRNQTATPPTLRVAMGQPDPAPVAYPAQPPYGGYGAKQPAGTS
ncbi:uncharacterized protein C2845_PM12G19900 [Panicum miliaceum]|uniref:Uncharacterized protein n=1 Tax=Panicum miliaceum TaxID=4540 RepID=A0A3L6QJ16_PANMI|nr:uncharacterized protein C2845_PM12G19900 [Panicum miliaceum]